jgi:hypothetical protein
MGIPRHRALRISDPDRIVGVFAFAMVLAAARSSRSRRARLRCKRLRCAPCGCCARASDRRRHSSGWSPAAAANGFNTLFVLGVTRSGGQPTSSDGLELPSPRLVTAGGPPPPRISIRWLITVALKRTREACACTRGAGETFNLVYARGDRAPPGRDHVIFEHPDG